MEFTFSENGTKSLIIENHNFQKNLAGVHTLSL